MNKHLVILAILFVMAISGFVGTGCRPQEENGIVASGTIEASEFNLSAEAGGKISEINFSEGQTVKKGEVAARIDSAVQTHQVLQAEAGLRAAQERARETKTGTREQLIAQARAAVEQFTSLQQGAKQTADNAAANLERLRALEKEGGATAQQVSDAETRYETAMAQLEAYSAQRKSAQEQLDLLKSGATKETINIADAGVAQAQAALSIARAQLAKTVITSPAEGIVSTINFKEGEFVAPGAAVGTIMDLQDLWITVYVPETDLPKIKLGQRAEVRVDAYPEHSFAGEVVRISDKAEFTPKNLQTKEERVNMVFAMEVRIKDNQDRLKPGIPADVTIHTR